MMTTTIHTNYHLNSVEITPDKIEGYCIECGHQVTIERRLYSKKQWSAILKSIKLTEE